MASRRDFLRCLALTAGAALTGRMLGGAIAMGKASLLELAMLRYEGNWQSRPTALRTLAQELDRRTSVRVRPEPAVVSAEQQAIFRHPLLWMSGGGEVGALPPEAVRNLRRHLTFGGTLVADDASGKADSAFSRSLRRELSRLFPGQALEPLPAGHAVYRAFYFLSEPLGRATAAPYLQGLTLQDRAAVILSPNDLLGALERTPGGGWRYELASGNPEDRVLALRLAVNLVIYALTVNYKLDQVHISYRLRHPELYPEP